MPKSRKAIRNARKYSKHRQDTETRMLQSCSEKMGHHGKGGTMAKTILNEAVGGRRERVKRAGLEENGKR